jgi:hypothetical protein
MDAATKFSMAASSGMSFVKSPAPSFMIGQLVTIRPNGEIEYGKDYTPDAAAKAFWDAIGLERKNRLP